MVHRPRSSPLHAARAAVGSAWCVVVSAVALSFEHPVVLLALLAAVLAAGALARVGREVRRAALYGLPFALVIAAVNPLVTRDGVTVLLRGGEVPVLGALDVTLEATAYGALLGLRALIVICCFALHSAAVDPDDLLRAFRRVSFRTALTAALATRMVPLLARDGRRMAEAQRAAGATPSRAALVRAVATGAMDRALDVAATLEVRGYGSARRPPRSRRPWSRHDLAFALSALALAAAAVLAHATGAAGFEAYPRLAAEPAGLTAAVLAVLVLLPFGDRRGVGPRESS